jgi:hypothetical protein
VKPSTTVDSHEKLISEMFYHELDENQQQELNQWLTEDPANADLFMREAFVHRYFLERRQIAEQSPELAVALKLNGRKTTAQTIFQFGMRYGGFAAAAVLLLAITLFLQMTGNDTQFNPQNANSGPAWVDQQLEAEWARITDRRGITSSPVNAASNPGTDPATRSDRSDQNTLDLSLGRDGLHAFAFLQSSYGKAGR